jgi:Domain of unknown function (DUF4124)
MSHPVMHRPVRHRPVFKRPRLFAAMLAAMLAASTAFAGPEVNKCVDAAGRVTLTDEACPSDARTEVLAAAPLAAEPASLDADSVPLPAVGPGTARVLPTTRVALTPAQPRHDAWVGKAASGRSLAVDVATLKAARLSMRGFDNASASMRRDRLAGLN